MRDFIGDTVPEVLLAHGGDPRYEANIADRNASRLLLLDGSTGGLIGSYVDTPDKRELYSSPVLLKSSQDTEYVLFGTGGETVPGKLYLG